MKKKETAGVLSNRHRTGQPRKTTAVDDRNVVRDAKKNPIINNLHRAGVKVSQSTILRREQQDAIPQDANHSSVLRIGRRG